MQAFDTTIVGPVNAGGGRFLRSSPERFRTPSGPPRRQDAKTWDFRPFRPRDWWRAFYGSTQEHHMVRAAVLSIVLTLVIGPNAGALCSVWCHPEQAATSSCPHQDATTSPG
jgi:hypothetical protein